MDSNEKNNREIVDESRDFGGRGKTASEILAELTTAIDSGTLPLDALCDSDGSCYECGGGGDYISFKWKRPETDEEMRQRRDREHAVRDALLKRINREIAEKEAEARRLRAGESPDAHE